MNTPERKNAQSKQRRQFTPSQKAAIVKRHLVDGVAVSALCDEYDLKPTQFYQWQKQLFENADAAFERKGKATAKTAEQRKIDQLQAKPIDKNEVVDYVRQWSDRTELRTGRLVKWIGIGSSKFYDWKQRYGKVNEHNALVPRDHWLEDHEKRAILDYHA